jgi:8-oxo-dGTP pyrophosphatase MutT (NUDIX family)/phosphohistidine phosphatase SixA
MPDPAAAEIRSAGAVLSRRADGGDEVALIHRGRYDDWSFPKGKREPGEHALETAVREVAEETGIRVTLGRRLGQALYQSLGRPKRVDYWAARPADPGALPGFVPNDEVDVLDWLPGPAAAARLSYERDVSLLAEFAAEPADTIPFILLRHASAGSKRRWSGNDLDRPLDPGGAADAERLAQLLACFGYCRVISSGAERCVATVRPYAQLTGVSIEIEAGLTMPQPDGITAGEVKRAAQIVDDGKPTVICAHGENLAPLLHAVCARLGTRSPEGPPLRKAGWWVLHTAGGALAGAERYHPADT